MLDNARFPVEEPYNLDLSLETSSRFSRLFAADRPLLRTAVRVNGVPVLMEVQQVVYDPPVLSVAGVPRGHLPELKAVAKWMLFAHLSLSPFYRQVEDHRVLGPITHRLAGLKPTRPQTVFEMAVTAVTEQQISMTAAHKVRSRLVAAYGDSARSELRRDSASPLYAFPTPQRLAGASLDTLRSCGLSRRKAEYITGLARAIVEGSVDPENWTGLPDPEVRAIIEELRGFGPWSSEYILVRGLGRLDSVPASDLGVRTVVGAYLGDGSRLDADGVRQVLAPFRPYRGLTAFYLLAFHRQEQVDPNSLTNPMQ